MALESLKARLVLPVIAAPMYLVSGPELVIACCRAGVVGSFNSLNARTAEDCDAWLRKIGAEVRAFESGDTPPAPHALNLMVRPTDRFEADLAAAERHQVPIVITGIGDPSEVVRRVHGYGGLVLHDIASVRHAEKAITAGVDGLILLTAGAGGHTGQANPFALVSEVRTIWDGGLALAGGISDGRGIRAAEILGADLAYMGTRFAATTESRADDAYKAMLVASALADVVTSERVSGLPATFLRPSLIGAGLDPDALPPLKGRFTPDLPERVAAWRDVWSAGHGVGAIVDLPEVAILVSRLRSEYATARA